MTSTHADQYRVERVDTTSITGEQISTWYVRRTDLSSGRESAVGGQFREAAAAEDYIAWDAEWTRLMRLAAVPAHELLDQAAYEAACTRAGLTVWTDAELDERAYALRYMTMHHTLLAPAEALAHRLGSLRLGQLDNERAAARRQAAVARSDDDGPECAVCGMPSRDLMNSSVRGAVCPDCYDTVEAQA